MTERTGMQLARYAAESTPRACLRSLARAASVAASRDPHGCEGCGQFLCKCPGLWEGQTAPASPPPAPSGPVGPCKVFRPVKRGSVACVCGWYEGNHR